MRDGFRAFDADTHVNPAADVLDRYVDPAFRPRLAELAPYRVADRPDDRRHARHRISTASATKFYRRVLGQAGPHEIVHRPGHPLDGDQAAAGSGCRTIRPRTASRTWTTRGPTRISSSRRSGSASSVSPTSSLEVGLIRAYHRHAADFCGQFPGRLKTAIVASTRAVDEAVREIQRWGTSKWAVAVLPVLAKDVPLDHPDLEPIWQAAQEHDLAVVHHSNTWNPPYFPAYQDLWDNIFLGRLASHPWGGMRFMAAFIGAGIMDRYPRLRMGILECGFGWLPFWAQAHGRAGGLRRRRRAAPARAQRVPDAAGGSSAPSSATRARTCSTSSTSVLGDDVLMYASDYPHSECQFPDSVDNILRWSSLKPDTRRKLLWDNAARFYKQT